MTEQQQRVFKLYTSLSVVLEGGLFWNGVVFIKDKLYLDSSLESPGGSVVRTSGSHC